MSASRITTMRSVQNFFIGRRRTPQVRILQLGAVIVRARQTVGVSSYSYARPAMTLTSPWVRFPLRANRPVTARCQLRGDFKFTFRYRYFGVSLCFETESQWPPAVATWFALAEPLASWRSELVPQKTARKKCQMHRHQHRQENQYRQLTLLF